ncbi:hypothetical protein FS935_01900 [Metabacillus litoralis]|uniref:Uncharacterized protein n=1 Tax=Metabacillus litoralis TaxID=152268 RepID=A0A5C6W595_9BACI|nr:hypothetical protein [Metabacillus litoralis]TXC92971.1 hypothetical protein FS935_01900 [Metabacillus litoralis]
MNTNSKRRVLQEKYKEKIAMKKYKTKYTLEVLCVIIVFVMFVYYDEKYRVTGNVGEPIIFTVEDQLMNITFEIDEKLKANYPSYKSISIDYEDQTIIYYLNTSLSKIAKVNDQDIILGELIDDANSVITSKNLPHLLTEKETYEIIVRGRGKVVLKREVFFYNLR